MAELKRRGATNYNAEITDEFSVSEIAVPGFPSDSEDRAGEVQDPLYDEAVRFVVESRKASISSLQRKLRVGYNRAARLIETMEEQGLVSPMTNSGAREVLAPDGGNL